jgi:hypothetical protein
MSSVLYNISAEPRAVVTETYEDSLAGEVYQELGRNAHGTRTYRDYQIRPLRNVFWGVNWRTDSIVMGMNP